VSGLPEIELQHLLDPLDDQFAALAAGHPDTPTEPRMQPAEQDVEVQS
jgi:hypothetical protein